MLKLIICEQQIRRDNENGPQRFCCRRFAIGPPKLINGMPRSKVCNCELWQERERERKGAYLILFM